MFDCTFIRLGKHVLAPRSKISVFIAVVALIALVMAARIAYDHYRAVQNEFEPAPIDELSRHPEQLGIATLAQITFSDARQKKLQGWYVPSRNRAAVVLATGTNADRSSMLAEIKILSHAGFGVLAFDWPGNGASEGNGERTLRWDAEEGDALTAAVDWLMQRDDVDHDKVGGLGFSIGGYLLTQVAAADPRFTAVVLEGTATDFAEFIRWRERKWGALSQWPALLALRNSNMPFTESRPIDVIAKIAPRAVFIIGGELDPYVPAIMPQSLYAAAQAPKSLWLVPGALHGGYAHAALAEYEQRLVDFFTTYLKPSAVQAAL